MRCAVTLLLALIGLSMTAPPLSLESDLLDFLELIPLEEIKTIVDKHLRNDKEFQAAIQYLQGDEWSNVIAKLDATEQAQNAKRYLLHAGIDVDFVGAIMEELLGDISIKTHGSKKSVRKFLQEVATVVPHQQLLALYLEKMEKSAFFQDFVDKLTSERFHKLVEEVLATAEAQRALDALEGIEVDMRKYTKAVYAFVGWKESENL